MAAAGAEGADPRHLILDWFGALCADPRASAWASREAQHTRSSQATSLPVFLHALSTPVVAGSPRVALAEPALAQLRPDLWD